MQLHSKGGRSLLYLFLVCQLSACGYRALLDPSTSKNFLDPRHSPKRLLVQDAPMRLDEPIFIDGTILKVGRIKPDSRLRQAADSLSTLDSLQYVLTVLVYLDSAVVTPSELQIAILESGLPPTHVTEDRLTNLSERISPQEKEAKAPSRVDSLYAIVAELIQLQSKERDPRQQFAVLDSSAIQKTQGRTYADTGAGLLDGSADRSGRRYHLFLQNDFLEPGGNYTLVFYDRKSLAPVSTLRCQGCCNQRSLRRRIRILPAAHRRLQYRKLISTIGTAVLIW